MNIKMLKEFHLFSTVTAKLLSYFFNIDLYRKRHLCVIS